LLRIFLVLLLFLPCGAMAAEIQWLGHAAFRITSDRGRVILVDPFLTGNPRTPVQFKNLSRLGPVDLILITHGHADHVGDAFNLAGISGAPVALNADLGTTFQTIGKLHAEQMIRFNKSGPITPLDGITVTMVHAEHSSGFVTENLETEEKTQHVGGEPVGYVIELENGTRIYHAGDTGLFGDMRLIGEFYQPDVALLPIGGHFVMDPGHAAWAARELLRIPVVVPMHFGTTPVLTGTPAEFRAALGTAPIQVWEMAPGETRKLPAPRER
jgi:L-ascorbate metabolism protein UlaG (beta-lactamase superfamily)